MGIRSMVRFIMRVAALAAVAALLLQAACTMGFAGGTHLKAAAPAESGCHEPAPAPPSTPDPGHICCGGAHSSDALLTAAYMNAVPMASQTSQSLGFALTAAKPFIAATELPSCSPPGTFVLRI